MRSYAHVLIMTIALGAGISALPVGTAAAETEADPPTIASATRRATVTAKVLNIRAKPGTQFEVVAKVTRDQQLTVVGETTDWFEIEPPPDTEAWIAERFVTPEQRVNADEVRVRAGPGPVFSPFGYVHQGDAVECIGPAKQQWQRIVPPVSATVWASKAFVELEPAAEPTPEPTPTVTAAATAEPERVELQAATDADAADADAEVAVATVNELAPPEPPATNEPPALASPAPELNPTAAAPPSGSEDAPAQPAEQPTAGHAGAELNVTAAQQPEPVDAKALDAAAPAVAVPAPDGGTDAAVVPNELDPIEAELAELPELKPAVLPTVVEVPNPEPVLRKGVLISLKQQASDLATHLLSLQVGKTFYPLCYLRSDHVNLAEWEGHHIRVHGMEKWVPGWERPIILVQGVQLLPR